MGNFSRADRLHALHTLRKQQGCSHILISDSIDATAFCGFPSSNVMLLVSEFKSFLITDFRYQSAATVFCAQHPEWHLVMITEGTYSCLVPLLDKATKCGVQSESLTLDQFARLKRQCVKTIFKTLSGSVGTVLIPKVSSEIAAMKKAALSADQALAVWLNSLRYGTTELQAAQMLEQLCIKAGSLKPSFDTIVLFGARSALPHGHPSSRALRKGDFILVDFGCTNNGYCSDMTRTFFAGKATRRQKELYALVAHAQAQALAGLRAGAVCASIDAIARTIITNAGYGDQFGHGTGHGVGLRIHEKPRLAKKDTTIVPANAVVTVEPGVYIPGFGGVRIEDLVVTTPHGVTLLSHFSKECMELDL